MRAPNEPGAGGVTATAPEAHPGKWTPFVTIDSASTKDIDDALWIERTDDGFHIQVAIADPTRAVVLGSTMDERARLMGATVYAQDRAIRSMLPPFVSAEGCSLLEGKIRDAMLIQLWLDPRLEVSRIEISFEKIRSRRRLAYEDIQGRIENPKSRTSQMLVLAKELSLGLLANRRGHGALAIYDLARMMLTDEDGNVVQFKSREDTIGNIIIQEMMILANTSVAGYCKANGIPILYRTHKASPSAPPSDHLAKMIAGWVENGNASLAQIQKNFFMLAQKAKYEATANPHFALSVDAYCHMTSPLRRYADLASMRQLQAHLRGDSLPYTQEQLAELGQHLNEALEKRKLEREEGYKRVGIKSAEKALEEGKAHMMADHEVLLALKVVRNTRVPIPEALAAELIRRMESGLLPDGCYDTLFTEVELTMLSDDLVAAFARALDAKPSLAMHLQGHATMVGFINPMQVHIEPGASFYAEAKAIRVSDAREFFAAGIGGRKREAEQMAVSGVLMAMLERPRPPLERPNPVKVMPTRATNSASAPSQPPAVDAPPNSRGALTTFCQHNKIPDATYNCKHTGASHMPTFTATAVIRLPGGKQAMGEAISSSRKSAENAAAFVLLQRLQAKRSS